MKCLSRIAARALPARSLPARTDRHRGMVQRLRPHTWLGGRTPDEVYHRRFPANRKPRFEPRSRWPRGSPCAKPWALDCGSPGAKLMLEVSFHAGRKHLPVVRAQTPPEQHSGQFSDRRAASAHRPKTHVSFRTKLSKNCSLMPQQPPPRPHTSHFRRRFPAPTAGIVPPSLALSRVAGPGQPLVCEIEPDFRRKRWVVP